MAETKLNPKEPEFKKGGEGSKTRLYILLGILAVVAVAAVAVNFWLSMPGTPPSAGISNELTPGNVNLSEEVASILPQLERQEDEIPEGEETVAWETLDPFSLPMELTGVVIGGKKDLAIIKARQTTYIASKGDKIAGTWELIEINRDSVRLKGDTEEIVVELNTRD